MKPPKMCRERGVAHRGDTTLVSNDTRVALPTWHNFCCVPGMDEKRKPLAGLRRARIAAGYTQDELGGRLGVDGQTVYRWEAGYRTPSLQLLRYLAAELEVTLDDLAKSDLAKSA